MSITTYFYSAKGEEIKAYDLAQVYYPEYAHYDEKGNIINNIYNCSFKGCECSMPQGMNMPFEQAKEIFRDLRKEMTFYIKTLACSVYEKTPNDLTISQRELESVRLDVVGFSETRFYRAWLTKPSRKHPLGQVRADVSLIPEGVTYRGNGQVVTV